MSEEELSDIERSVFSNGFGLNREQSINILAELRTARGIIEEVLPCAGHDMKAWKAKAEAFLEAFLKGDKV